MTFRCALAAIATGCVLSVPVWSSGAPPLPAPAWLTSPPPTETEIDWAKTQARFEALDMEALPSEEREFWRQYWIKHCHVEQEIQFSICSKPLAALVRLRDEETTNWLLSQLAQGMGRSSDAAQILGDSGQESLVPRLEEVLFLKPEDEPPFHGHGDLIFGPVSNCAFGALSKIIQKSAAFTPRLKTWFALVSDDIRASAFGPETKKIIRKWWDANRTQIAAGDYRRLRTIRLWEDARAENYSVDAPLSVRDYLAALGSPYTTVERAALWKLREQGMIEQLGPKELSQVAHCLDSNEDFIVVSAIGVFARAGNDGIPFLRAALSHRDPIVRGYAAGYMLEKHPDSAAERARCIADLIASDRGSYMANHMSLQVEVMPLLKQRVVDRGVSDVERTSAASYIAQYATSQDLPFLEHLLKSSSSQNVRTYMVHGISRLFPQGEPPDCIRELEHDPEFELLIKEYHYLDKPSKQDQRAQLRPDERSWEMGLSDSEVADAFAELMKLQLDHDRTFVATELSRSGSRGIALLKLALASSSDEARGCAAKALLETGPTTIAERNDYIASLVAGLGSGDSEISNYLRSHPEFWRHAAPVLKGRILDPALQPDVRAFAALHLAAWATPDDLGYFEMLLQHSFPSNVRAAAMHAIFRIVPAGEPPDFVRTLASDPELASVLNIYRYLEPRK